MDLARLAKATITNTSTAERIQVMYNPDELRLEQGNNFAEVGIPGLDAPPVQYVRGKARTLAMDLFFDSYEADQDVRQHTGPLVRLLDKEPRTKAPPVLLFSMGQFNFQCVLVDASQRFTMFRRDGTPVRSTIAVRFQEFVRVEIEIEHGLFIGPPTLHNVVRSETASAIAATALGDPSRWREVAEANDLDDPLNIPPGITLRIPQGGPR
ncbi:peptigoglycan-binding protein LysM [Pelomonas sp. CA6]|uniref:CIS tube protein n=1 Tax=Pelomonas sp. CA6 TaxID=2907999 RepID=UPI001F4A92DD|nr:peptigoglycan-binding protein LysM [Pelomonas sp. CA6]MCH7342696.1 peptigoglycan-binding protein LysM [Pelomonas sp. CA6]